MKAVFAILFYAIVGVALRTRLDEEPAKRFPVSKVVQLLTDMKAQLEKEADADEHTYEKMACFCETNDKEKTKSIADAAARLTQLEANIQRDIAGVASLEVEIKGLTAEVAKDQAALESAVAMREKQAAEFTAEEKEMIESIQALNAAVVVMSKHHKGDSSALLGQRSLLRKVAAIAEQHASLLRGVVSPQQKRMLASFMQGAGGDYFDSSPTFNQAYAPQSGEIFGILSQMKQTFEENLAASQKEEMEAMETFAGLKTAKENEIEAGQNRLEEKKELLATTSEKLVQAKEDRADTEASKAADEKFLQDLKERCAMTDEEWEERQKLRLAEVQAVSKAIEILSSDESRELFTKVFNPPATPAKAAAPSFVQLTNSAVSIRRARAADVLLAAAVQTGNPKLALVASQVRLDAFTRVKKAIDDLVSELVKEQASDVEHKDNCVKDLNENEVSTAKQTHTKANLQMKVEGLEAKVKSFEGVIEALQEEIKDMQAQREKARENRELDSQQFNATRSEQQQAQALLQQAHEALEEAYDSITKHHGESASLAQQTPPKSFETYGKNRASSGVLAMIEEIIKDSQQMEAELVKAEFESQDAYHGFVQQTQEGVDAKGSAIVDRRAEKSAAESALIAANGELEGVTDELGTLASGAGALHQDCDFALKNFDVKQKAIEDEIEALRQAKAFLSGMEG